MMEIKLLIKIGLLLLVPACLLVTVTIIGIAASNTTSIHKSNANDFSVISAMVVTPAEWILQLQTVIFIWQIVIGIYMLSSLFITYRGQKLYTYPNVFPISFLLAYLSNLICGIVWVFTFELGQKYNNLLPLTVIFLIIMSVALYACLAISAQQTAKSGYYYHGNSLLLGLDRVLLHNGLAIYLGWTTVAHNINIAISLHFYSNMNAADASSVSLSLLLAFLVFFFSWDLARLDRFVRYVVLQYVVIVIALVAIIDQHGLSSGLSIYTFVVLAISGLVLVAKIATCIYRHLNVPIIVVDEYDRLP